MATKRRIYLRKDPLISGVVNFHGYLSLQKKHLSFSISRHSAWPSLWSNGVINMVVQMYVVNIHPANICCIEFNISHKYEVVCIINQEMSLISWQEPWNIKSRSRFLWEGLLSLIRFYVQINWNSKIFNFEIFLCSLGIKVKIICFGAIIILMCRYMAACSVHTNACREQWELNTCMLRPLLESLTFNIKYICWSLTFSHIHVIWMVYTVFFNMLGDFKHYLTSKPLSFNFWNIVWILFCSLIKSEHGATYNL